MSTFIQLHLLTSYPPSNLNRDELGRPKTAIMGGEQRLRISSQCLKRAWRTSDVFEKSILGIRSKEMGKKVFSSLMTNMTLRDVLSVKDMSLAKKSGISEKDGKEWAWKIASVFVDKMKSNGKIDEDSEDEATKNSKKKKSNVDKKTLIAEQMVFFYPDEIDNINCLIEKLKTNQTMPTEKEFNDLLVTKGTGIDVGMFGRMMANSPIYNVEAAVQVAHAITVHKAVTEDDFFTAVDDLNKGEEHAGSAHLGETEFGAGFYYIYACVNRDLLKDNLQGDEELVKKAIRALAESAVTISPSGKQNSFGSRSVASYVLVEKGKFQPRSLSAAFLKAVTGKDIEQESVVALTKMRDNFNLVYNCKNETYEMHASQGKGKLEELLNFAAN